MSACLLYSCHGTRDPFGSPEEMEAARQLLPGPAVLSLVEGAGQTTFPRESSTLMKFC